MQQTTTTARAGQTDFTEQELRRELQATLAAHRDLGPDYDKQLIDAFLGRVDPGSRRPSEIEHLPSSIHRSQPALALGVSLALAIPLCAVAGAWAGPVGTVAVLVLIGFLNLFYGRR